MIYTVVWKQSAEDRLAEIWTEAPDRQAVADAADQIDRLLRLDPQQHGNAFPGGRCSLIVLPLGVVFEINDMDRRVRVLVVWYIPRHLTNGAVS